MSTRSNINIVILITLIGTIGIALPYPILSPLFLTSSSQINVFLNIDPYMLLGISLAVYPLGILIGSRFLGALSDHHGRRPVLLWSLLVGVVTNLFCAWAIWHESFVGFILARFATGILEGNISIARAVITDYKENINQTSVFGYISAAAFAGWFIGPFIGGYTSLNGFYVPFAIAAGMTLLTFTITFFKFEETLVNKIQTKAQKEENIQFWKAPGLLFFIGIQFLLTLAVNIYYEFYPVYLVEYWSATPEVIANATMILTLFMVLSSTILLKYLTRKLSNEWLYFLGILFSGISFIVLIIPTSKNAMLLTFILTGTSIALYNSTAYALFSKKYSNLPQGRLMGTLVATFCLANVIAALFGSWLASMDVVMLIISGGVIAISVAIIYILKIQFDLTKTKSC